MYMIVLHHFGQDIECIRSGKMRVVVVNVGCQFDCPVGAKHSLQCDFQLDVVLIDILVEFFSP